MSYLAENARRFTAEYIGLVLERTTGSVRMKASRMKLQFSNAKLWTREDTLFLKDNAWKMKTTELAAALGRNAQSIRCKASYIGISLCGNRIHSQADVDLCRALFRERVSIPDIAEKMEIPAPTVRSYVYGLRR